MINYLHCEYELPVLDKEVEPPPDWSEVEFQTPSLISLGKPLDKYTISEDGLIYREEAEDIDLVIGENGDYCAIENFLTPRYGGIERVDGFTGEIRFNCLYMTEKHDYWLEFVALYKNGELLDIARTELEKESNKKRKEAQKKFVESIKEINNSRRRITGSIKFYYMLTVNWISESIIKLILFIRNLIT